jgi:hypothetical protein
MATAPGPSCDPSSVNGPWMASAMHVHVYQEDGEAKVWMDPSLELAQNHGLSGRRIATMLRLTRKREDEIRYAWGKHFGG